MHGDEVSDVTQAAERWMREKAVAELYVEEMDSGAQWLIGSWDRRIDRAIAEAFSAERYFGAAESCELVQILLTDEVLVRIADAGAVHIGCVGIGVAAGGQCPCRDGASSGSSEPYGCLCGCHFGGVCRKLMARNHRGGVPHAAFLFHLQAVPDLGPVFMRSRSWALSLWLRDLVRSAALGSGALDARIRLRKTDVRTRSGVEVALSQPVGQRLPWGNPAVPFRLAA